MSNALDPDTRRETRRAILSVAMVALVALAIYLSMGLVVHRDAPLADYGRDGAMQLAMARLERTDRETNWGDRPVLWILGSSIPRDGIDHKRLRSHLVDHGLDWGVEKFTWASSAPVFVQSLVDQLDIRAGDVVVTGVAYGNFRPNWLELNDSFDWFFGRAVSPIDIWNTPGLRLPHRLELMLSHAPPASFHHHRYDFVEGLEDWKSYALGWKKKRPVQRAHHKHAWGQPGDKTKNFRRMKKKLTLPDSEMLLTTEQPNFHALLRIQERVEAQGAELWVVHLPHHPEYYELLSDEAVTRYHAALSESLSHYVQLGALTAPYYRDYRHANRKGRPVFTDDLAERVVAAHGAADAGDTTRQSQQ